MGEEEMKYEDLTIEIPRYVLEALGFFERKCYAQVKAKEGGYKFVRIDEETCKKHYMEGTKGVYALMFIDKTKIQINELEEDEQEDK